ncbi:interleukin-20 receptor subunit beta [Lampetra fluviatilis]
MCHWAPSTLTLLALLRLAGGEPGPTVPRSVRFSSLNLKHLVSWEPALMGPRLAGRPALAPRYSVQVLGEGWEVWRDVPGCVSTPRTECDVSDPLDEPELAYRARVALDPPPTTLLPGAPSPQAPSGTQWAYSDEFMPSRDTLLSAVSLSALGGNASVELLLTEPLTPLRDASGELVPLSGAVPDLIYLFIYWRDGSSAEEALTVAGDKRAVLLEGLEGGTSYCAHAQAWVDAWSRWGTTSEVVCATTLGDRHEELEAPTTAATVGEARTEPPRDTGCGDAHWEARADTGMGWVYGLVAGAALLGFGTGLSLSLCLVKCIRRPNSVHPFSIPAPSDMPTSPTRLTGPERII